MSTRGRFHVLLVLFGCCFSLFASALDQRSVQIPLAFEPNRGQADARTTFLVRTPGGSIALTRDGAILSAETQGSRRSVRIRLHGTADVQPLGESPTGGFANYYRSQDRSQWLTRIPLFSRIRYSSIYKGIDVVFHGHDDQLEYDFEVLPQASASDIRFTLEGADHFSLTSEGALEFTSGGAGWRLLPPSAYQKTGGVLRSVSSAYRILPDKSVGFTLGNYDHSLPLTIDPVVAYSQVIGVNNTISVSGIQVDDAGDLFIAGHTFASNYPVVNGKGALPNASDEVFITKLDPTGSTILYSTYIPASGFSSASSLALDTTGNAYIAGIAGSSDFPLTSTNLGACAQFCNTGFVAKFAPDGTMVYSTLLSSNGVLPKGIVVDVSGNAYVAGLAAGPGLPTVNAFEPSYVGLICTNCTNAFFAKLNTTGTGYEFASYFANPNHTSGETFATGIAVDGPGNIFIAGQGDPPIVNPWQIGGALFIAKFAPDGKTLLFSSGFGGGGGNITGIAAGADGTLFLAGRAGGDFPFTLNAAAHMVQDNGNGMFAAAVDPTLTKLVYSTYLGDGNLNAINLNAAGHLFVAGSSVKSLLPLAHAVVSDLPSGGFALELDPLGAPVTVTQFGGHLTQEAPTAIAADTVGNLYVAGPIDVQNEVPHPDPVVVGGGFGQITGFNPGSFIAKIGPANVPQLSLNPGNPILFLRNAGSADLHISSITFGGALATRGGNCLNTVPAGSSCVLAVADATGGLNQGTVTITSDAQPSVRSVALTLPPNVTPGTPIGDFLWFSDTPAPYPPQSAGSNTDPRVFTISNIGFADATINAFFANGGVSQTNNCPTTLTAGASCSVQATVTAGVGQPSLRISYDNGLLKDFELFVPVSTAPFLLSVPGINFGIQQIQGVAVPRVITVTNTTQAIGTVPQPFLTGDPEFTIAGNTCAASLAPHQSCVVGVQFNPVIAGSRNAILTIGGSQVQLGAQGEFNSVVQVSPLQLNFFPVIVHRPAVTSQLLLTNTSASPVGLAGFVFSLPDYTETDDCLGQVPANGSCTVQVAFSAQAVGARDATMTINFLGGAVSQTLTVAGGVGVTPLDVTPASLNFGSALTGTTSASQGVLLGNGRQGAAQGYTLALTGDFVISQNVCANPMPGFFGCFIQISFTPKTPGPQQGTLTVSYPGITEQSVVILNGTGVATAPVVSLPATFDLGSTPVAAGIQQPVTISNVGNADLTISGFSLSGTNAGDFSVAPGQCATVVAGTSCSIQVGFNPGSPLLKQATLTIADNGLNNPHTLALTGTGVGPSIRLPGPTFIGQLLPGSSTNSQVLISNIGNADLIISSLTVTGANAGDFKADIGLCATVHAPSNCLITVSFTPTGAGTRTANIVVTDNQVGSPQSFVVTGTGLAADYTVPATLDFGNQVRGSTSTPNVLTIKNTGPVQLQISSIVGTADFSGTHNCFLISTDASCTITVSFTPTATGLRTGTLTIADNSFTGSHQINLTGNGIDFQLSGSGNGPVSATVTSGQTATYNLSLTGSVGFTGAVTLACSGAPQAAGCTVSPASVQLSAGSVPFTVTVTTQRIVAGLTGQQVFVAGLGLVSLLPLIPLLFVRRLRTTLRSRAVAALSVALFAICLGLSGCGGGSSPSTSRQVQNTPPGTYNLTVTATSAGVSRQINLTLVVQ